MFQDQTLYIYFIPSVRDTCPIHLMITPTV